MAGASEELKAEMLELNLAYQERFGHVFLICATGRDRRADARRGEGADRQHAGAEREIVRTELGKINRIRLTRLAEEVVEVEEDKDYEHRRPPPRCPPTSWTPASAAPPRASPSRSPPAPGATREWVALGGSATDADGRCKDLPALPEGTTHVRLDFAVEAYFEPHQHKQAEAQQDAPRVRDSGAFFPEVAITFAVKPGEHYHVPLLLNPFGYSVYRGS